MPGNKFKTRFPPARIKKIMQADEEVGKVAAAVPVIVSKSVELFTEILLRKSGHIALSKGARTLSIDHIRQCVDSEHKFDFLREIVREAANKALGKNGDDASGDCPSADELDEPSSSRSETKYSKSVPVNGSSIKDLIKNPHVRNGMRAPPEAVSITDIRDAEAKSRAELLSGLTAASSSRSQKRVAQDDIPVSARKRTTEFQEKRNSNGRPSVIASTFSHQDKVTEKPRSDHAYPPSPMAHVGSSTGLFFNPFMFPHGPQLANLPDFLRSSRAVDEPSVYNSPMSFSGGSLEMMPQSSNVPKRRQMDGCDRGSSNSAGFPLKVKSRKH